MRNRLTAQGQHAGTCCSPPTNILQVKRTAAWCPQQSIVQHARCTQSSRCSAAKCHKMTRHDGTALWPAQTHRHAPEAAAAASPQQHVSQQALSVSSGMHNTLLHAQQHQVAQLLHVRTQHEMQQQPDRPGQPLHHSRQCDSIQLCHTQASAATAVQQRCESAAYHHQGNGHDKLQHHQQLHAAPALEVEQQGNNVHQPPGDVQQQLFQQHHRQQPSALQEQQNQLKRFDQQRRQQRLQSLQHPAQFTGWINNSSTVQELAQLYQQHNRKFNHINLAAMLVKLARIAPAESASEAATVGKECVHHLALQLAQQLVQQFSQCDNARQAANASWALAVLQCDVPEGLLQQAAQQLLLQNGRLLAASQPQELAMLAWGLAKLQHDPCCSVWQHVMVAAQQQINGFKPQELAMLMWSLAGLQQRWHDWASSRQPSSSSARLQQPPVTLGHELLQEQDERHSSSSGSASSPVPAYRPRYSSRSSSSEGGISGRSAPGVSSGRSGNAHSSRQQQGLLQQQLQQLLPAVCSMVTQHLQQGTLHYKAQELASLLWSFAELNCRDVKLLQLVGDKLHLMLQQGQCNCQDVSNSLWALGKLNVRHSQLLETAAATASCWLPHCSNQELSLVLYGCAAAWRPPLRWARQCDSQAVAAASQLWQQGADQVQQRLLGNQSCSWGVEESATVLQAVAFVLQPVTPMRSRPKQAVPQQQDSLAELAQSDSSSSSSVSSMSGSWDGEDSSTSDIARELAACVDEHLVRQLPPGSCSSSWQFVPCILSAFATAQLQPSPALHVALLSAAQDAAAGMNRQQLCMTTWAAAKLAARQGCNSRTADATVQLIEQLESVALGKLSGMQPQQLSILAWAHSRLWKLGDSLLLHELARVAVKTLPRFGPQALSNLTWALARARHYDGAFAAALGRRAKALLGQFSPAELSNLAWGLITLRYRQLGPLTVIASHVTEQCSSWDAKACAKLAAAYASDGMPVYRFKGMFWAMGDALTAKSGSLTRLTAHELAQLAAAFAVARVKHKALAGQVAAAATQQLEHMALVDVVQLVWALACLNHRHDVLLNAVSARVASEMDGVLVSHIRCEDRADGSSSPGGSDCNSSNSSSSSWFNGKLRPQYLPRLAWAYKTLQHEDACWYMGAARLAADMGQSSCISSSALSGDSLSSCSSMSMPNRVAPVQRGSSGGTQAATPKRHTSQQQDRATARRNSAPGCSRGLSQQRPTWNSTNSNSATAHTTSISKGGAMYPMALQRPLYQQPAMDHADILDATALEHTQSC